MNRSCSKIYLVKVYPKGERNKVRKAYAIIDDQSNRSLTRSDFFDTFGDLSPIYAYSLKTCAGVVEATGRKAQGYKIESMDGQVCFWLPSLIECDEIPNNRSEIPMPDIVLHPAHLRRLAQQIPKLEQKAQIMLLLRHNIIRVHKVCEQINGPCNAPYTQKLDLGWVIVGNVCLGRVHKPPTMNAFYTNAFERGQPTTFEPCPNTFLVKEKPSRREKHLQPLWQRWLPSLMPDLLSQCRQTHMIPPYSAWQCFLLRRSSPAPVGEFKEKGHLQRVMEICSTSSTDLLRQIEETIPLLSPEM